MIDRFFADGLHWVFIAIFIVIGAAGVFFLPPVANPDIVTHVVSGGVR